MAKTRLAPLESRHLGETASRCADVETDVILDFDGILLQRARQFYPAPRNKGMRRLRQQHGVNGNGLGWLHDQPVVGHDEARFDGGLRPRSALEQAPLDQQHVRALAGRGHSPVAPGQVQLFAPACVEASRPAAMRTQVSNAVKSCQMSTGACRGVTSAQPCRSSA